MRKEAAGNDGQPERRGAPEQAVSRRRMLIGSGGLMLGLAGLVGCAPEKLAGGTLNVPPTRTTRPGATHASGSRHARKAAHVTSTEAPPRSGGRPNTGHSTPPAPRSPTPTRIAPT